jgi:hypothetical protein
MDAMQGAGTCNECLGHEQRKLEEHVEDEILDLLHSAAHPIKVGWQLYLQVHVTPYD